ncbi:hypothetical protein PPH41_45195, partial [Burkholderia gladioli]|nr:hypothetical protein [Burkholderia gladioli]
ALPAKPHPQPVGINHQIFKGKTTDSSRIETNDENCQMFLTIRDCVKSSTTTKIDRLDKSST